MKTAQCILEWEGLASEADPFASIKENMFPCMYFLSLYIFMNTWKVTVNTVHVGNKHENVSLV